MIRSSLVPAFLFVAVAASFGPIAESPALAETVYSSLPVVPTGNFNVPSLGYQATQTKEFGDHVVLGGTARNLTNVTVGMSTWALKSTPANNEIGDADSYTHPLTLNIYNVATPGSNPTVGSLITTKTVLADIPYRPEVYTGFNGMYFTTSFNFTGMGVTLPNQVIVGLAFNTQTYGDSPLGVDGPYNSLNFAVPSTVPTLGTDANPDSVFWNTSTAAWYTDGGAAGVGTFRSDSNWTGNTPAFSIDANVPEPASLSVLAIGATALLLRRRKN